MRLCAGLFLASLFYSGWCPAADEAAPVEDRFEQTILVAGLLQPMQFVVCRDGRIIYIEFKGKVKILHPGAKEALEALNLSSEIFNEHENGLLGLALDPDFEHNHWLYLHYSPKVFPGHYVSRFTLNGDQIERVSEKVLLSFETQRSQCCHHAGSICFGPDGCLFISSGDNTYPAGEADGYAPIDERKNREPFDAQKSASNTHDLRGKILRIKPNPDGTAGIPDGNLFPKDGTQGRPEIYVMGCRNPWRISVDQRTGILYWGEVGPDAGGDKPRGPRGYDEINQAKKPGNFGWPYFVADNQPYARFDFASKKVGEKFDANRPVNESVNNTGAKILPPAQPALLWYPYGKSDKFPELNGEGGRTACAGPVYHADSKYDPKNKLPRLLRQLFIYL